MDTDGACGLLFCAAKRSGAFPPNMPAGTLDSRCPSGDLDRRLGWNYGALSNYRNQEKWKRPPELHL